MSWNTIPNWGQNSIIAGGVLSIVTLISMAIGVGITESKKATAKASSDMPDTSKIEKSPNQGNIYDSKIKGFQLNKNSSFENYIRACAEVQKTLKEIENTRAEYEHMSIKEKELGALSMNLYSVWTSPGSNTTFENDTYKEWQKVDIEHHEVQNTVRKLFAELCRLNRELQSLIQQRDELYRIYQNDLKIFENLE